MVIEAQLIFESSDFRRKFYAPNRIQSTTGKASPTLSAFASAIESLWLKNIER